MAVGTKNRDSCPLDRITEDGVLCKILSSLRLKEAVRTCVLSRRWRYIWTHLPILKFDPDNILDGDLNCIDDDGDLNCNFIEEQTNAALQMDKFIASVNSVLRHHEDLRTTDPEVYEFPFQLLGSSWIESLLLTNCSLKPPKGFDGLRHLKNLHIALVDFSDEDIGRLLSNCFTLERLLLSPSPQQDSLSISHPLSRLNYLKVINNFSLEKIEINAPNLMILIYHGHPVDFKFRESSQLKNASMHFTTNNVEYALTKLSNSLPQLENLNFLVEMTSEVVDSPVRTLNKFNNLRGLVWEVEHALGNEKGLLCLASLLSVAPFLENLTVEFFPPDNDEEIQIEWEEVKRLEPSSHNHLKIVEFTEFIGIKWQFEFAVYILQSASELESMTLHLYEIYFETGVEELIREVTGNVQLVIF